MTARTPLKLDGDNLREMTADEIGRIQRHCKYLYGQNPSVGLGWVSSGGSLGNIADTRVTAGAVSTSISSLPNEATTAEPGSTTVNYGCMDDSAASVTESVDTNQRAFPLYWTGSALQAMTDSDFYDTFIHDAITELTDGTDQPGTYRIHSASSLSGHTLVSGNETLRQPVTFVDDASSTGSTMTYPAGILADDLIIMAQCQDTVGTYAVPTDAYGGTWNMIVSSNTDIPSYAIHWKVATGSESSGTLTHSQTTSASVLQVWRGADVDNTPFTAHGSAVNGASASNDAGMPFNSITTTYDNEQIFGFIFQDDRNVTLAFSDAEVTNKTTASSSVQSTAMGSHVATIAGTHQFGKGTSSFSDQWATAMYAIIPAETSVGTRPIFTDTRVDTTLFTAAGIGEAVDQPGAAISNFYLFVKDADSDEDIPLPAYIRSDDDIQGYDSSGFNSLLSNSIRYVAGNVSGSTISYNVDGSGNNKGTGMTNTILTGGSGDHQTLQVSEVNNDDYRAQEFPDGSPTTANTYYLKINKA